MAAPDPIPESIYDFVLPEPYIPQKYKDDQPGPVEGEKSFMVNDHTKRPDGVSCRNPDTFIWGQDVANKDKGGVFNVTKGMQQEFGDARVFSAPITDIILCKRANGMRRFDPKIHVVIRR